MPETTPPSETTRLSLLVVDDHPATADIMAKLLRRRGHTVVTAGSCAEARVAFAAQDFDFLISDLALPDGSGHELLRELRACSPVAGIAISGSGDDADIQQAQAAGFARHFTKPLDIEALQRALLEICKPAASQEP
ncbi:MAG: response regulator [Chthoniobacter sp.]|nr:response regulator [Chthoniobacter sp.]